jgi:curved DNA-binding protein CbpA
VAGQQRDYYALLGVGRHASAADNDRAYRRAARATHPDIHPDDSSAGERFTAVALAYETLSDPTRRASYDRRQAGPRPVNRSSVRHHPSRSVDMTPVHLGRRRVQAEPLRPIHPIGTSRAEPVADGVFEAFAMLTRLLRSWE